MTQFQGRVEARMTIPAGGASVSASTGALSSPVTVTVPAGSYYHTAAGGVSSLLDTLETQLNAGVSPYPQSAVAFQSIVGFCGTPTVGYLCQETSGNLGSAFGAPATLTAVSTPTYSNTGPANGGDLAVGFDSAADAFTGGDVFDLAAGDDLVVAFAVKFSSVAASSDLMGKGWAPGWFLAREVSQVALYLHDGVDLTVSAANITANVWYAVIAVLDRTNNQARIGACAMNGSPNVSAIASTTAVGAVSNASNFVLGANGVYGVVGGHQISAAYVGTGSGLAGTLVANLSTAVQNFANAIGSSFTVSMSPTTGQVSISHSFLPSSVQFTSTDLRDVLGFAYDFDYPATAAQMATALGYGAWANASGWLFNISSGNDAGAFGGVTMTAVSTPTYSNQGARGGADKAIGFDSAADAFYGGDSYNAAAGEDLILVWVGYLSAVAAGNRDMFSKFAGFPGWYLYYDSGGSGTFGFTAGDGAVTGTSSISPPPTKEWYVGIAVIDRGANTMRIGTRGLRSGTTTLGAATSIATLGSLSNGSEIIVGTGGVTGGGPDTNQKIAALYVCSGGSQATGLSANLSTALSNFASYMLGQTGTESAEGVWLPDCPLNIDGDPTQAPRVSDLRTTRGPTGVVLGLSGNSFRRHRNLVWSHVPIAQVWESESAYSSGSFEHWFETTQMGFGHEWFTPSSPIQVYWANGGTLDLLGGAYNSGAGVSGWSITGLDSIEPRKSVEGWTGLFRIEFPELISSG